MLHGAQLLLRMWDLLGSMIEQVSPADGFFAIEPPEKPRFLFLT